MKSKQAKQTQRKFKPLVGHFDTLVYICFGIGQG